MASPAATFTMILSDVVGDHLEAIASGPTTLSSTTAEDAWQLLGRYDLLDKVPNAVRRVIESSRISNEGDRVVSNHHAVNTIIGSNRMAAEAALVRVKEIGFRAFLLTTRLQGEARRVGQCIAAFVKSIKLDPSPNEAPICVVLGGETTVTVLGKGVGGRNQELALSAAIGLAGWKNVAVMTLATDGVDGPTPAAGAIITGETVARARVHSLDALTALKDNDSYTFFQALGDTVLLGPTGTNVNDLLFCLVYRS
jgi:glycerate 2-kinase